MKAKISTSIFVFLNTYHDINTELYQKIPDDIRISRNSLDTGRFVLAYFEIEKLFHHCIVSCCLLT